MGAAGEEKTGAEPRGPDIAALPLEWAIGARIDADWDSLDAHRHLDDFQLPILLFHGDDDEVVPISGSEDFAHELPRWVTFEVVPRAGRSKPGTSTQSSTNAAWRSSWHRSTAESE